MSESWLAAQANCRVSKKKTRFNGSMFELGSLYGFKLVLFVWVLPCWSCVTIVCQGYCVGLPNNSGCSSRFWVCSLELFSHRVRFYVLSCSSVFLFVVVCWVSVFVVRVPSCCMLSCCWDPFLGDALAKTLPILWRCCVGFVVL